MGWLSPPALPKSLGFTLYIHTRFPTCPLIVNIQIPTLHGLLTWGGPHFFVDHFFFPLEMTHLSLSIPLNMYIYTQSLFCIQSL